jgi:uncharacterized membrane protein (DUF4010 family)
MDQDQLFRRLGVALAIGLLIGLERGWQARDEAEGERTAGLRTYALAGLLGGIAGALSLSSGPLVLATIFLAFAAAFTLFRWVEATSERDFSVTGVVAGQLTFALGAYAVLGQEVVAVAAAVAMAILLALKAPLHTWLRRLTWMEIRAVLILLAMSCLLLPVLPNRPVDPWGTLNPAEIWLLAILIAGVSFAGYVAVRMLGDEAGIAVAAVTGGLASSTATTLSLARLANDEPKAAPLLAGGILVAGVVMLARVLVVAGVLNPGLIAGLAPPLAAAALVMTAAGAVLFLKPRAPDALHAALTIKNPFEVMRALKLAALIAVIMVASKALSAALGTRGVLLVAAASGLADVDALTLSMARLAGSGIAYEAAITAILLAVAVNTATKAVIATSIGGLKIGRIVSGVSAVALLALGAAYAFASVIAAPVATP